MSNILKGAGLQEVFLLYSKSFQSWNDYSHYRVTHPIYFQFINLIYFTSILIVFVCYIIVTCSNKCNLILHRYVQPGSTGLLNAPIKSIKCSRINTPTTQEGESKKRHNVVILYVPVSEKSEEF